MGGSSSHATNHNIAQTNKLFTLLRDTHLDYDAINEVILAGANINFIERGSGLFPLSIAALNNDSKLVKLLLDRGANALYPGEKSNNFPSPILKVFIILFNNNLECRFATPPE